ncbi:hypothetical protein GYA13_01615 [Candidatus Kuenenbacteria bacterium]|nr:hypothetical protein [Candidatus Kuenenbacteria bacterium]
MFKKGFVGLMVFAMVLTMGVTAFTGTAEAVADGSCVKVAGSATVFYVNGGKAYVFPNEKTYKTWYPDFTNVVTISSTELATYTISGNVTYRPGTRLVKITDVATVYAVEPGGVLRSIVSEANAKALYGDNWNKMIDDVPTGFFVNYTVGSALTEGMYPSGTLVKASGSATTYYIDGTTKRPIATGTAFEANGLNWANVLTASSLSGYTDGTSVTAKEDAIANVAGSASANTATGSSVTVALAASTAPATTIISDTDEGAQSVIPFVTVNFTAPADGDVTVTALKYKRTGISADADFETLYLYEGNTKLYEGGTLSSGYATFSSGSGLFTVAAGTTKAVTLRADLKEKVSAGKTVGFQLETVTTKNSATVSGTLPIAGNVMTTASVTDLGYVTYTHGNVPTSPATVNPGEKDFEAYKLGIQANDQDMQVEYMKLTLLGSVNADDLQNLKLTVGGATVATGVIDSNRELVFDMTGNPYRIDKGQSKTLSVRADVVKGSTRTFRFSVEYASDLVVKDRNYNVYVTPFGSAAETWTAKKSAAASPENVYTINAGSLTVTKDTTSPTENVPAGATNVKLATFRFEATGEDVKVSSLLVKGSTASGIEGGLDNGKVYLDGVQVGSTKDLNEAADVSFTFGSSFIVKAGTPSLVDIYADIKTVTSTSITAGTVQASLSAGSANAQGTASLTSISTTVADGTALTVSSSALNVVKYSAYGSQNIVKPATAAKIASFVIQAGAYEGVDVDTINVDYATSGTLQNMKLMDGSTQLGTTKATLTSSNTTDNVFSVSLSLAANETKVIDVYADVLTSAQVASFMTRVDASGTSKVTGTAAESTANVEMQTMTLTDGAIVSSADGSKPEANIVIAGSSKVLMNAVKFAATNDAYTITKVRIDNYYKTAAGDADDAIGRVILSYKDKNGTTVEKEGYLNADHRVDFTGLNMYVAKDSTAVLSVYADVPTVASGADSGDMPRLDFDKDNNFSALGEASNTADTNPDTDVNGNAMVVRKTRPTVTLVSLPTTVLANGTQTISKFSVAADAAGDVYFKEVNFTYTTTTNVNVTAGTIKLYRTTDESTALNSAVSTNAGAIEVVLTSEEVVGAGTTKTYVLKGDITGTAANESISVRIPGSASSTYAGTSTTYDLMKLYETGGLLWSDGSVTAHTSGSADYADCNYVKNLPTDSQTLSK